MVGGESGLESSTLVRDESEADVENELLSVLDLEDVCLSSKGDPAPRAEVDLIDGDEGPCRGLGVDFGLYGGMHSL